MFARPRLDLPVFGCLIVFVSLAAIGCGGDKKAKGPSNNQQYEQALKIPSHDIRAARLISIAANQLSKNNEIGADKTLEAAILAAKSVETAGFRADCLLKIFALRASTGQAEISRDLLRDTSRAIDGVKQPSQKFSLLLRMANAYSRDLKKPISAKAALKEAEALMAELPEGEQLGARIRYAGSLELAGETEQANELMTAALTEAEGLSDLRAKAEALGDAAVALYDLDRGEEADKRLAEAEEAAAAIEDAEQKAHAHSSLARKMMMADKGSNARALLKQAMSAAEAVADPQMRNSIMDEINASKSLLE